MHARTTAAAAVACLAAVSAAAVAAPAPDERMSILYVLSDEVAQLTDPAGPGAPISGDRGAVRQDKGTGGMMDPAGRDAQFRMWKLSSRELQGMSAARMATAIRRASDRPPAAWRNRTGMVGIDEIGAPFNDGLPVRGRARAVKASSPGARLSKAMALLEAMPHRSGGTYADRVHLYMAPAFTTAIAKGRGPERNMGRDGKAHWATWRGAMPGIALAGGVWLQMYHGVGGRALPLAAGIWKRAPRAVAAYGARYNLRMSRLHLMFAGVPSAPAGSRACGGPMACQWNLAASTRAGRAMLDNGPGAYRLGDQARDWRVQFNRRFTD